MSSDEALKEQAIRILRDKGGPVRMKEFIEFGIPGSITRRLVADGRIVNPIRGVYVLTEAEHAFNLTLAAMASRGSEFVVCLRSAAAFHNLIDRHDARLWLALRRGLRIPAAPDGYRVIPVRWAAMFPYDRDTEAPDDQQMDFGWLYETMDPYEKVERHYGVEHEPLHKVPVRVTTPERTVCDLVRFMDRKVQVGDRVELASDEQIAVEALANLVSRGEIGKLDEMAHRLGCAEMLKPYLALPRFSAGGF